MGADTGLADMTFGSVSHCLLDAGDVDVDVVRAGDIEPVLIR